MEGRMNKYRQVSPERTKVWTEKSPKYKQRHDARKVAVVYYLCRNQQLEHPHFMEVPLSSSDGLYLRDVIERLNVLRGKGIASMYSWSCKRSYKNGYVWHDLCDDDIVHPAHGNDYILKGTELFEESNPGPFIPSRTSITETQKALPEPPSFRNKGGSPSPSSSNGRRATKSSQNDELSPLLQCPSSSTMSHDRVIGRRSICKRGVSTDDDLSEPNENQVSQDKDEVSVPPSAAAAPPLSGGKDTLESLVRADIRRILEEDGCRIPANTKLKVANTIIQLITCGSVSAKNHKFPLICGSIAESSMLKVKDDVPTLRRSSYQADSCRSDKEKLVKIEESLLQELGL